jgi:hypothetical protein
MKKIGTYKSFKINESSWEEDDDFQARYDNYEGGEDAEYAEYEEGEEHDIEEIDDNFDSEMSSLCETIKSLYDNANLSVDVDYGGLNILIYAFLEKKEKIRSITKILDISNKLKKDILPQYDSEFEIYESEEGYPIMYFEFTYNDGSDEREEKGNLLDPNSKYSTLGARLF